jgi:hypothetical protein
MDDLHSEPPVSTMKSIALLVMLACPGLAIAQDGEDERNREIEREILRMRDLLRSGKLVTTNVRLNVRLKNGNRLRGVVKNGRLIEKVDGLHFVAADTQSTGAGVRLWYYDSTNSYIFLPFNTIFAYSVGEKLTTNQVLAIEKKIDEGRVQAERARETWLEQRKLARRALERAEEGAEGVPRLTEAEAMVAAVEQQRLLALLRDFPPEKGWGAKRHQEIEVRKVTIGVFPNKQQQRFLDNFEDWQQALEFRESLGIEGPLGKEIPVGPRSGKKDD